ncbi:MAG: serine hydrolase domain-containing protein [Aureispira sp.]
MKITLIFSLLLLITISSSAQTINKEKLDNLFKILSENHQFMGSISVTHKGKQIYSNAIGHVDLENNIKATAQTRYRIGSISKMFTTVLTLKAAEQRKFSLEDPLSKWFPKVKNASKIKIKHLLNHRSGIYNFVAVPDYLDWNTKPKTRKELLQLIESFEAEFEPDAKARYSNSNYVLLTFLLEDAYGTSYKVLIEKLTKKLQLKNTYLGEEISLDKKECYSYTYLGSWNKSTETDMSVPLGAGAIISTSSDLNSFIRQLFSCKIINKKSLNLMKTIQEGYGSGLFEYSYGETNKVSYGHTGGIDGFHSMLAYLEEDDLSIAICANGIKSYTPGKIRLAVLHSFYQKDFELPIFKKSTLSTKDLDQYLGTYATEEVPFKLIVTKEQVTLLVEIEGSGQPAIPLEEKESNVFEFRPAGLVLKFNPETSEVFMTQGGNKATLKKE